MASELRRGFVRVASNYLRLGSTVVMGLLLAPVLVAELGAPLFGVWGLIGSTIGIGEMFREIVRRSLNRELGAAFHDDDPSEFPRVFNSAIVLCLLTAVPSGLCFVALALAAPLLNIPEVYLPAVQTVIAIRGGLSVLWIISTPLYNMYVVSERMVLHNAWVTIDRATLIGSATALLVVVGIGPADPSTAPEEAARAFVAFALAASTASAGLLLAAVAVMGRLEPRTRPRRGAARRSAMRRIVGTGGWNTIAVSAMNLHIRVDQLLMNLAFGPLGNAGFTLAVQLSSYVRMVAIGMTDGLDAVTARFAAGKAKGDVAGLARHAIRMHAVIAFPALAGVLVLAEPLLELWIGGRLGDPEQEAWILEHGTGLIRVLVVGFACRAVADCWIHIMYGAGKVRAYAPLILAGGIANPLLAGVLYVTLPEGLRVLFAALAYTLLMFFVHLLLVPLTFARAFDLPYARVVRPLARPIALTVACLPVLLAPRLLAGAWTLPVMLVAGALFAGVYGVVVYRFVLLAAERGRLARAAMARLPARLRRST